MRFACALAVFVSGFMFCGCAAEPASTSTGSVKEPVSEPTFESVRVTGPKVMALGSLWTFVDIQHEWPGGEQACLRALNEDLMKAGVTHKAFSSNESVLIECAEARRCGLKLFPRIAYMSYGETLDNTEHNQRRLWAWIAGLRELGLMDVIDGFWVSDDVKDDTRLDRQGPPLRGRRFAR